MVVRPLSFAERLQKFREQSGLTVYALAKRTGLSKQGVGQLESGRSEPSWTTVQLLALALDVACTAFVDPSLTLPELEPAKQRGRPRKVSTEVNGQGATAKTKKRKRM